MGKPVVIVGAGLAGSECALQLAERGFGVELYEMRPRRKTAVHETQDCAELVCSNSFKSTKAESAAGMLKSELRALGSVLLAQAEVHAVPAGGALAVDRSAFAKAVTRAIEQHPNICLTREEVVDIQDASRRASALVLASGPLTSDALAERISSITGQGHLSFFDAAAPIVEAATLDFDCLFQQSRYGASGQICGQQAGDYLNAPFSKEEYERFIDELVGAQRVMSRDFESRELFQACQPIEEIARRGLDAPRFGPLKPVGLTDPRTGKRPWAALQLRAENLDKTAYNLVGFQTNLKFGEQDRVFRMIPGLQNAVFSRHGVMHRNTFIDAPRILDERLMMKGRDAGACGVPIYVAGQLAGTEGYCEAIRAGIHVALAVAAQIRGIACPPVPPTMAFGALLAYATNPQTVNYQPMHVNFGIMPPLDPPVRNKRDRYAAYAKRASEALKSYVAALRVDGLIGVA